MCTPKTLITIRKKKLYISAGHYAVNVHTPVGLMSAPSPRPPMKHVLMNRHYVKRNVYREEKVRRRRRRERKRKRKTRRRKRKTTRTRTSTKRRRKERRK